MLISTSRTGACIVALLALLVLTPGNAGAAPVKQDHLTTELISQGDIVPGAPSYVGLRETMEPGWHTYWINPGDAGEPTKITWTLPAGWKAGPIVWPTPERIAYGPLMNYGYNTEVVLPVAITPPAGVKPGETVTLKAHVDYQVCSDVCVPGRVDLTLDVKVASGQPVIDPVGSPAIVRALERGPRPSDFQVAATAQGATLKLSAAGDALKGADVSRAYFFPYEAAGLNHAAPQAIERGTEGLTLTLTPVGATKAGAITGVLSLGETSYEVAARDGPPLAGTSGGGTLPPTALPGAKTAPTTPQPAQGGLTLVLKLLAAFGGGLILNLMPCVFPILSMKAAALARHASEPGAARAQGLAFLGGVIATFLILAGLLIAARAGGQAVGWGFQLQSPGVVAGLALIMLAAALNLSGVFEIGLSAQGAGQNLAGRGDLIGSAFTGALAVIVAAPCTAPFMAGAIGWALVQPPVAALAVFAALGLGLAAPFTALCFWPALFRRLPKPGVWMDTLKKVLAFPMYGAAAWLAWVFAVQTGINALPFLFASAIAVAFAAWAWGASQHAGKPWLPRIVAAAALIAAIPLANAGAAQTAPAAAPPGTEVAAGALPIEPWSPERVAALQAEGKPVFVDFTAAWCVTCQVNERTALAGRKVADAFKTTGAVYLKADWTNRNAEIAKALAEHQREGVPLYLVYGKTGGPVILPQLLSEGLVVEALTKAAGSPA